MQWQQGEHVSAIGPTGTGKTTLMLGLLPQRRYVCVIGTKKEDPTLDSLIRRDRYKRIGAWPPPITRERVILWPKIQRASDIRAAGVEIGHALDEAFSEGSWTIVADEVWYLCKRLGLTELMETYWTQGRSAKLTLVAATQRPAHVPLFMYSQATHLFVWRDNDKRNLDRLREISSGALISTDVRRIVETLDPHVALYLNTRTGTVCTTKAPRR
jgi:hypothetical protein